MMRRVGEMLKAIYAAVFAALTGVGAALVSVRTFSAITDAGWVTIASLTLVAFGGVYGVTNAPKNGSAGGGP